MDTWQPCCPTKVLNAWRSAKAIVDALAARNPHSYHQGFNHYGRMPGTIEKPVTRSAVNTQPLHMVRRETEEKMRALQTLDSKLAHMTRPR